MTSTYDCNALIALVSRTANSLRPGKPPYDQFRRFYLKLCNGTWIKVSKAAVLEYLAPSLRCEVAYDANIEHEKNVGHVLYISPRGSYTNEE